MSAPLFQPSLYRILANNGTIAAGANLYFYLANTTTLAPVYTTSTATTPSPNPVVADSTGTFPAVFLDPTVTYRIRWTDALGSPLRPDVDPLPGQLGQRGATGDIGPQGPVGSTVPSRRIYLTYSSAVSDAATPVIYAAPTAGVVAEVPITDTGTHTDPVVGGTVNNTGIFRWSVSPAGWQRISDEDAVSAQGLASAFAATVIYPRDNDKLTNFNSSFGTNATINADNTLTLVNTNKQCSMAALPAALLAARTAGTVVAFLFEKKSGADLSFPPQLFQKNGISNISITNMVALPNGSWSLSTALNGSCDNIAISFQTTGTTTMRFPGYALGTPARPEIDPLLIASQGMANSYIDSVAPVPFIVQGSFTGGTTYTVATGNLVIPNGGGSYVDLYCPLAVPDTKPFTVTFDCNEPLHNVVNGLTVNYQLGHSGGSVPTPQLERVGPHSYQVVYQTLMAGGFTFDGPRILFSNTSGITVTLSNFQVWVTDTIPATYKVPAIVKQYADTSSFTAISDVAAKRRVHIWGDSTSRNASARYIEDWPYLLQQRCGSAINVINHAFGGNVANVGAAQAAATVPTITVSGNSIPADFTPVSVTSFSVAPIMSLTGSNLYLDNIWMVAGRKVRVSSTTYDGSQMPTALTLTAVSAQAVATPVPAGSKLYCVQGLQATNDFHIIDGWFNSAAQTLTGMQPFIDRFGIENCLLMPALNALSGGGGPNAYTAAMTAKWPGRVFDQNGGLTAGEISYLSSQYSYTLTSQDITDNGNNLFPTGMRLPADNLHTNLMGSDIISQRVYNSAPFQQMLNAKPLWDGQTGEVRMFPFQPSSRWLRADGSTFSSSTYPELFAVLGSATLPNISISGTSGVTRTYIYTGAA